jgi:hypothetical protein
MQHRETPRAIFCEDFNPGDGKKPAELRLKKAQIKRIRDNSLWKHPPESAGSSPAAAPALSAPTT